MKDFREPIQIIFCLSNMFDLHVLYFSVRNVLESLYLYPKSLNLLSYYFLTGMKLFSISQWISASLKNSSHPLQIQLPPAQYNKFKIFNTLFKNIFSSICYFIVTLNNWSYKFLSPYIWNLHFLSSFLYYQAH